MSLDELVPLDLLAEMQTRVELDNYASRVDFVSRRVSHHRTLAQRAKAPAPVDASGDALMAAMSASPPATGRPSDSIGTLAEAAHTMQQQLLALLPDYGNAGDLDALGKNGGKGKKGAGIQGFGSKGGGGKGPSTAGINGACWGCGVFGHRQSECPALDARSGQQYQDKGGKSKGGKAYKGDGKEFYGKGKGKGINEIAWDPYGYDSGGISGWEDYGSSAWGLTELAAEQSRGPALCATGSSPSSALPQSTNGPSMLEPVRSPCRGRVG